MAAFNTSNGPLELNILCSNCGRILTALKRCKNCKTTFYCSRECQAKDWPTHKGQCYAIAGSSNPMEKSARSAAAAGELSATVGSLKIHDTSNFDTIEKDIWIDDQDSVAARHTKDRAEWMTDIEQRTSKLKQGRNHKRYENQRTTKCQDRTSSTSTEDRIRAKVACPGPDSVTSPNLSPVSKNTDADTVTIKVKTSKQKHKLTVERTACGDVILRTVASKVHIPLKGMKLIHKGKLVTEETVRDCITNGAVFQAIGQVAENEEGLRSKDIECVMDRIKVDRNTAIKALRTTGDVIDAILFLGNK